MGSQAEMVLDVKNIVGESTVWDDRTRKLYWVDIVGERIHSLDPVTGEHRDWVTPDIPTSIGLAKDGGMVVGLRKTIVRWNLGGSFDAFAEIEPETPDTRLNEGCVGPDGAFWVGTMQNNINPDGSPRAITASTGRLYRVTPHGDVTTLSDLRFGITNTLVWPDAKTLITADTMENAIYAFDYNPAISRLYNRKTIVSGFERGLPDGSCMDAEGFVWNCRVAGGGCVIRFSPDGRIVRVVDLPCSWPTSCAFGGNRLDMLYVTSARFTMGSEHLALAPWEGNLFRLDVSVRGTPANRFG